MDEKDKIPQFICINGDIIPDIPPALDIYNRSFNFGDGFCEEMRTRGNKIIFFDDHWNNIKKAMSILKMNPDFLPQKNEFESIVNRLINRNRTLIKSSVLRLNIFRKTGTSYNDISDQIEYSITAQSLDTSIFTLQPKGVLININTDFQKNYSLISEIRTNSAVQKVLALIKAKENRANDALFLNQNNHLVEFTNSNLFIVKDNTIITPPLSDGCFDGVMRKKIIEIATETNFKTILVQSIAVTDLYKSSEIWLVDSVFGIQWVMGYRNQRYFNKVAQKMIEMVNKKAGIQK